MMSKRVGHKFAGMALVVAVAVFVVGGIAYAVARTVYAGDMAEYTTAHSGVITGSGVTGHAHLTDTGNDTAVVSVQAAGLEPGSAHGAHVHNGSCTDYLGHFKYDPTITTAERSNEVWLDLTANSAGRAVDQVTVAGLDLTKTYSLVIHASANPTPGARIACADLTPAGS